jgi:hypothetical protein
VIAPRFRALYEWSAAALNQPGLASLLLDGVPAYAWSAEDSGPWDPPRSLVARLARRMLPRG